MILITRNLIITQNIILRNNHFEGKNVYALLSMQDDKIGYLNCGIPTASIPMSNATLKVIELYKKFSRGYLRET